MIHEAVYNVSNVCHQLGVRHAVMSPGSRNAPLTISFARHKGIEKWVLPDERTAGFIALGIAQETKTPVVLCCTSGTAVLNYAPAIAEAYYREIPLIVLSADRPPELIDQRDGQTIRQYGALKNHVKESYKLPVVNDTDSGKHFTDSLIKALQTSKELPKGPVHLNVPFREPFYPSGNEALVFEHIEISELPKNEVLSEPIDFSGYKKVLLLIGQHDADSELNKVVKKLASRFPVIRSPLNNLQYGIMHLDAFIKDQEDLKPDLLITAGLSVLSKKTKQWIRKHKPAKHMHIDPAGVPVDTYDTNPELIKSKITAQLSQLQNGQFDPKYLAQWKKLETEVKSKLSNFFDDRSFSEALACFEVFTNLPADIQLHLSNSMPVRYADLYNVSNQSGIFSNRGTSGIDGCTSSMIGTAMVSRSLNLLVTGDLAFLYDRNAFFHPHVPSNIRIIILNNQGGGIFRLIDGPAKLSELETYFETRHNRTAKYVCAENNLEYMQVRDMKELKDSLATFYETSTTGKVMEIFTDPEINQKEYKLLKQHLT